MEPLRPDDPREIGPYRLERRLGGGGMGQVFLGRSRSGRPVAVKVVRPELAGDAGFRRRFTLEAEAARRVGGFYTAQVVDADPDADPPWLVTAYIPGPSLQEAVGRHGPLPEAMIGVLGLGLAEGLAAIHRCDLVHRDLKPSNVILAEDGPRVIDFGIARALDATSHTTPRAVLGTPSFMSPEQARGGDVGPPSDVFSFASVLVFAATGRTPFGAGSPHALPYRIVHEEPDLSGVPAPLLDLLTTCFAKDPGARPAIGEVLDRLDAPGLTSTRRLPPDLTTLITERRAETRTAEAAPRAAGRAAPVRTPPVQNPEPADLVVGNLSGYELDIVVDGSRVGAVGAYGKRAVRVPAGTHTVRVKAGSISGVPRRFDVRPGFPTRVAYDVPPGHADPVPADEVTFIGSTIKRAIVTGFIVGLALIALLLSLLVNFDGWGGLLNGKEVGTSVLTGVGAGLAGFGWHFYAFRREKLTLGSAGITFLPTSRRAEEKTIRWEALEQVSLIGSALVVWYRRDYGTLTNALTLADGTVVGKVGDLVGFRGVPRLRAALAWFAPDLYA